MEKERTPGDGVVTGHGLINGRNCFVFSQVIVVCPWFRGHPGETAR
jgi:acetyl-CoA carboxylase carboxyltransferase component